MNVREYDPLVSRFLSPDPYIQAPDYSQSFNRYSYVWNNPLKYTDPSGELAQFAWFRMLIYPFMVGSDFVANVVSGTENPWWQAKTNASAVYNGMNNCLQFTVHHNDNSALTIGISPFDLGISANYTRTDGALTTNASGGIGLSGPFLSTGSTLSVFDIKLSAGAGLGRNSFGVGGGITYREYGLGYYQTNVSGANAQKLGGVNLIGESFNFRLENDFFAWQGEDRFRTAAGELTVGKYSVGFSVFTNDPKGEQQETENLAAPLWGINKGREKIRNPDGSITYRNYSAWKDGRVLHSPVWFGMRSGNFVHRVGVSNKWVQNLTQNWLHQSKLRFGNQNYYLNYEHLRTGPTGNSSFYNPYLLFY